MLERKLRSEIRALIVIAALALGPVEAQSVISPPIGTRHRIDVQVSIEPGSPLIRRSRELKGTISPFIRISANSREERFYGTISPSFSDVVVSENASILVAQTKVWEEKSCHQRRGLPKVTVTLVRALFQNANDKIEIASAVRRIGLYVPPDELTPGIKLPDGHDDIGNYYAIRSKTRDSQLNVDLKIYAFDCAP